MRWFGWPAGRAEPADWWCGVIYNTWSAAVTGGNMEPLRARMDFESGLLPEGFGAQVTELVNAEIAAEGFGAEVAGLVNAEIAADRPVEVSFWPRAEALGGSGSDPHQGEPGSRVGDR